MGKAERQILQALPPAQGGGIGHQGKVPNGLHAIHRGAVPEGHRPPPERSHNLQLTVLYMSLKLPHFAHHNVVQSLTSRVQLCGIQYRMHGYGLISRANYKLVSHV